MKPAAYLISNATARELRFEALASDDKWHSYTTPPVETALYAIPVDQVLVRRELLERVCADRSLLPGHNMAINAIDELRAILQR